VAINADGSQPDGSAILDVKSTAKGMLIPRVTTIQRNAISTPATGLIVFDTDKDGNAVEYFLQEPNAFDNFRAFFYRLFKTIF
jgi:hypothetical protein